MAFEIPDNLSENLYGVAWLVGHWTGMGEGMRPGSDEHFACGMDIQFSHNEGDYLFYLAQVHELDDEGVAVKALAMESGFWRPDGKGGIEAVIADADGFIANWFGKVEPAKLELATDSVVTPASAKTPFSGGQRLYGMVNSQLLWSFDMATAETELAAYLWTPGLTRA